VGRAVASLLNRRRERQANRLLVLRGLSGKRTPVDAKAFADGPTDNPKRASIWAAAFGANISLLVEEKFPVS